MSSFDLLDAVLPSTGRYCVVGIGSYVDQRFADTREQAETIIQEFRDKETNVYFGCSKFGQDNNRTQSNVTAIRALWLDIDCGPTKGVPNSDGKIEGYIDQRTGLLELQKFCKAVGLPVPILINSGNGIHAYWLLEETLGRKEWKPLAQRLKDLCVERGLIVDPSVFEESRILRVPDSLNIKPNKPVTTVSVMNPNTTRMTCAQVKEILGVAEEPKEPDFAPPSLSPMMLALLENKVKKFETILTKSEKGEGCAQLLYCKNNQNEVSEPLWFSALSIAAFCSDGDRYAHEISKEYTEYNENEVWQKLRNLRKNGGPHSCAVFERENPKGCEGCPHKGKIKSPVVLGIEIAEAKEEDNVVVVENNNSAVKVVIPEYPFPFVRGKKGGIYKRPAKEEEEVEPVLVYEHDLYVVKRMRDPGAGEVALFRLHLPHDGMKEFAISTAVISSEDELKRQLAQQGVVAHKSQYKHLATYVVMAIKNLQYEKRADIMRTQFGWTDNDSKFIFGDKEITKDGTFYSPPSADTKLISEKIHVKGSFDEWKRAFNMYARPGLEPHAFGALTAFGALLFKFTGLDGAIINVIHPDSGTGKSTILRMCNSVYGSPKELMAIDKDTINAKMLRLGVMNNLALTIDEITNMKTADFSDFAYGVTHGRGKDRVKASENAMRINNTTWKNLTLASANASFYEKLSALKKSPDGENMRVFEYEIEPNEIISVAEGKEIFDHVLNENYGHAGEIFISYLVNNLEGSIALLKKVQARIDRDTQISAKERYWSSIGACNIAAGLIAKNLGLHEYDMPAIYGWLTNRVKTTRIEVKRPEITPDSAIGEFMNAHIQNILVVNGDVDSRSGLSALPLQEPRGELLGRYEPDTKQVYIPAAQFKDFCVKSQTHYTGLLRQLAAMGIYKGTINKRISKGMKVVTPVVRALHFDVTNVDSLHFDLPENDNREPDVQP
jgi:hypothetical protein